MTVSVREALDLTVASLTHAQTLRGADQVNALESVAEVFFRHGIAEVGRVLDRMAQVVDQDRRDESLALFMFGLTGDVR